MTATDWRQHDTPAFRAAFQDAQARLDEGERQDGQPYTLEQRIADDEIADRYDRLVLQPAHAEFEQKCEDDEFSAHWPEPPDGSRIEFEADRGILFGAFREDDPDRKGYVARWYVYGDDQAWSWRDLVFRYRLQMDDLTLLIPKESAR